MEKLTKQIVLEWIKLYSQGNSFTKRDVCDGLEIASSQGKNTLGVILHRLHKEDSEINYDDRFKVYRLVDGEAPVQNWKKANTKNIINLKWPFELEKYVKIFPKSLIVVGGDSNAGKSAFGYNIIDMNYNNFKMILFNSESGDEELKERLSHFPNSESWPDDIIRFRSRNFADVIKPDYINIIDYIEPPDPVYLIGQILRDIWEKLNKGVAIIMLQKPKDRDLPLGKGYTQWLPRMLLAIDRGKLTIVKAKSWVDKDCNPNGMGWTFQLINGAKFINPMRSDKED